MSNPRQAADPEWSQLLRLGEQLVDQPVPVEQCSLITQIIGQLLSARAKIWLASPAYPLPGQTGPQTLPDAPATPLVLEAMQARRTVCDPSMEDGESHSGKPETANEGPRSVAIPLTSNGTLLGVVQIDRLEGPPFSETEISQLEGLIAHASLAMEVTRQETVKNWRLQQLGLVRSVGAQISSLTDLSQLYSRVTRLIQETFRYYYVAIFTLDERRSKLIFRGSAGQIRAAPLQPDFSVNMGEGIIGTVAATGSEIIAADVRQEARYRFIDVLPETQAEAALPLKVENRILGVLDVQSDKINALHEVDVLVLGALADTIAMAIESARLYASLERRAEQMQTVFEIGHALTSILDLDELLNQVVQLIHDRFGYPFVHVYTVHPGRRLVFYQTGTGERSDAMKQRDTFYSLDAPQGLIPWVARNGRTFLANDVLDEPLYRPVELTPSDTRAELTVPLIAGDEVLGVLDIQSREPNAFDGNDQSLFEALAAPIAIGMRNANLYRSEQWRRQVAESFRDVAHLVSSNLPLDLLLNEMLEQLETNLPCDASAIWLLEDVEGDLNGNGQLRLAATRNIDPTEVDRAMQSPVSQQMLRRALETEHPLIRHPGEPYGPLGAALGFGPDYSSIAAPMRTGKRPLGIIALAHHQNKRYGSEAQAITATFASYAAVAIQNARLYSESQEQALISTMLLQVAEASQSIMTVDDLLATMVRLTRLLVGVRKTAFLLWDDSLQSFELKAWYGFEPEGSAPWLLPPRMPALARLAEERTLLYLENPGEEIGLPELSLTQRSGTLLMLPLLVRGELIGAFLICLQMASRPGEKGGFDPKAKAILQGIAHQTAMTVDNLRLLESRQEEAYVTAALLQVAQAVVSTNDLNDTLDTIIHLLPILVGLDTCIIYLWDSANQLFRPTQVNADNRREEEIILSHPYGPGEHQLLDSVRQYGEMFLSQLPGSDLTFVDWAGLPCQTYEQLTQQTTSLRGDWLLAYPLSMQGQVLGILLVRETTTSASFWERRLEIIHGIAQHTSLAIQNDLVRQEMVVNERIDREIALARQIQETFLPEALPKLPRWEVDLRWETAREVGGDFYDIFKLDENRLGLVIADVSDKGLPAALYMTVARTLIRANAAGKYSPAEVLKEVNALLVNDSSESMFITTVYAILSLDSGELLYANAGHNRPLIFRKRTGKVEQLPKGGTALGILYDLELVDHQLRIFSGDAMILYTDGVTDIMSPEGDFFGEERLQELILAHGKDTIHNILEALDDALIEFRRGTPPADDITLLAVRREPSRKRKVA